MDPKEIQEYRDESFKRATSNYAELYFWDEYCDQKVYQTESNIESNMNKISPKATYTSPSDLLIGLVHLKPPFTGKITQAKAHEGIVAIGEKILLEKHRKFIEAFVDDINSSNEAWELVLQYNKPSIMEKVKTIFDEILQKKYQTMMSECSLYYEKSLSELEEKFKSELETVLQSVEVTQFNHFRNEITKNIKDEGKRTDAVMYKKFITELKKVSDYYALLLRNEKYRNQILIDYAIQERNKVIQSLINSFEAEKLTTTMYILCMESKKCKAKKIHMENYLTIQVEELMQKYKAQEAVLREYKKKQRPFKIINQEWEDKIQKILTLFVKFISFSLKLLPQQTSFLLEFQSLLLNQINDIQKHPNKKHSIIIDEAKLNAIMLFEKETSTPKSSCKEPFTLEGKNPSEASSQVGSVQTIASDISLDFFRVQKHLIYAKCHKYEEVKRILNNARCKCHDQQTPPEKTKSVTSITSSQKQFASNIVEECLRPCSSAAFDTDSSENLVSVQSFDIERTPCPMAHCGKRDEYMLFPQIDDYFEYDDVKYQRVKGLLGRAPAKTEDHPTYIDVGELIKSDPFSHGKDIYRDGQTQYSNEDALILDFKCPCVEDDNIPKSKPIEKNYDESPYARQRGNLTDIFLKNSSIFNLYTNEKYDFIRH